MPGFGGDDLACRLDAVEARHVQVHHDDIGEQLRGPRDCAFAICGFPDRPDAEQRVDQRPQPAAKGRMVVGDQDPGGVTTPPSGAARPPWRK